MSDILEHLAELDRSTCLALGLSGAEEQRMIARHTAYVARAASRDLMARNKLYPTADREDLVRAWFPLPPRKVLREEPDPHAGHYHWRYEAAGLQYREPHQSEWIPAESGTLWTPTPERIDLWADLKNNPYREEPE